MGSEDQFEAGLTLCKEFGQRHVAASTNRALGSLHAASSDVEGARESLTMARDVAAEIGTPGVETLARCELACLPGGNAQDALTAFTENEERLNAEQRREARFLLFQATGDRAHVEEAKRLLDESVAHVDDETRESMLTNLRVNREIMAAWTEQ